MVVVDDILALVVIATVYTEQVKVSALLAALGVFGRSSLCAPSACAEVSSTRCSGQQPG